MRAYKHYALSSLSLLIALLTLTIAMAKHLEAREALGAYESARASLESYRRLNRSPDSSYICKLRP